MFENVTYSFYSDTLGRSVIPDEATFNRYKLENVQEVRKLLPFIIENDENGIDSAVCLMIEIDYESEKLISSGSGAVSSESVSGHSVSYDNTQAAKEIELNAKTKEQKKLEKIRLFNYLDIGVC